MHSGGELLLLLPGIEPRSSSPCDSVFKLFSCHKKKRFHEKKIDYELWYLIHD
jgi:hypothetical protein